jgi:hypothetical protein
MLRTSPHVWDGKREARGAPGHTGDDGDDGGVWSERMDGDIDRGGLFGLGPSLLYKVGSMLENAPVRVHSTIGAPGQV